MSGLSSIFLVFLFGKNLANLSATELNCASVCATGLRSVLLSERSEANVAMSIIKNIKMAISQMAPATTISGDKL